MQSRIAAVLMAVVFTQPLAALAQHAHEARAATASDASKAAPLVEGTVKKVDRSAGKLTLAHGPLENLGMPAMTMVFRVKDSTWLERVKEGDKVRFEAQKVNGALTVVQLETL